LHKIGHRRARRNAVNYRILRTGIAIVRCLALLLVLACAFPACAAEPRRVDIEAYLAHLREARGELESEKRYRHVDRRTRLRDLQTTPSHRLQHPERLVRG
jgi:hypothetical protein